VRRGTEAMTKNIGRMMISLTEEADERREELTGDGKFEPPADIEHVV
jgi:hypothetical protein